MKRLQMLKGIVLLTFYESTWNHTNYKSSTRGISNFGPNSLHAIWFTNLSLENENNTSDRLWKNVYKPCKWSILHIFVPREKRKVQKQRQKLQEKMKLKMIIPGDIKGMETDMEMFSLANIKSKQVLVEIMSKVRDMSQC